MRGYVVISLLLVGCVGTIDSNRSGTGAVFDANALAKFQPSDRAFVQGHALGVFYFAQAVPSHVPSFTFERGLSAPHAQVAYDWNTVVVNPDAAGTGSASSGACNEGIGSNCGSGSGSGSGSDTGTGSGSGSGSGDGACETFLSPATTDAKNAIAALDVTSIVGDAQYVQRFQAGVTEALASEDQADHDPGVEFGPVRDQAIADNLCTHSPLVLDLDGSGIAASSVGDGVAFDLLGTGRSVQTAWPTHGALLALDRDGDGRITSGSELFGNNDGARDGFAALAAYDRDGNGVIDARDPVYASLRLWRDTNRDGASSPAELVTLAHAGVAAIELAHATTALHDPFGNPLHETGRFVRSDGSRGDVADVWFRFHAER